MHKEKALVIFLLLFFAGVPVFAGAADREGGPAGGGGTAAEGETQKPFSRVEVKNGSLSVELVDAGFGEVMNAIAEKSGIKVEIIGGVYAKTVTTSFAGLDLERGIVRLLSLVKEKNYMMRYDAKGMVSKVEVYSSGEMPAGRSVPAKPRTMPPADTSSFPPSRSRPRGMPAVRKNPPASKRILSPLRETETDRSASRDTRTDDKGDTGSEGYEEETPVEPAENIPAYIPPRHQRE
jgi:hypothetical protein